ncbi:methylglyoxal synthase (plasmid) [Ruegeria pomeroyi DSS-3]|uniref:Methylglyoxal synthase n=2 Tax=Ruegeria pomeroyi TaxID=89184 RepID=Q5LKQ2_RUEPO|nr:methylglyoxal synthase [Ruegeria pomeroyi]AAV97461.1 methylglyoxal synthase [Ruegeria pomeroyi DSS-3]NVK97794.1 methylglyoxal synthase [Ruegeria pomeroyi]NVL02546.1 methylglyoxal synthase [Ruegeria pomeroyi]HCE71821.1 methylglyoxal synthase [Ruegeria sp.]
MLKSKPKNIALIAHDLKKRSLATWVFNNQTKLKRHNILATATTGGIIQKHCPQLRIRVTKSGPLGGDQQIGAMIADDGIDLLIFFTDPLSPHPHDVDVKALSRLAVVYDVPMACSGATADLIAASGYLD